MDKYRIIESERMRPLAARSFSLEKPNGITGRPIASDFALAFPAYRHRGSNWFAGLHERKLVVGDLADLGFLFTDGYGAILIDPCRSKSGNRNLRARRRLARGKGNLAGRRLAGCQTGAKGLSKFEIGRSLVEGDVFKSNISIVGDPDQSG